MIPSAGARCYRGNHMETVGKIARVISYYVDHSYGEVEYVKNFHATNYEITKEKSGPYHLRFRFSISRSTDWTKKCYRLDHFQRALNHTFQDYKFIAKNGEKKKVNHVKILGVYDETPNYKNGFMRGRYNQLPTEIHTTRTDAKGFQNNGGLKSSFFYLKKNGKYGIELDRSFLTIGLYSKKKQKKPDLEICLKLGGYYNFPKQKPNPALKYIGRFIYKLFK